MQGDVAGSLCAWQESDLRDVPARRAHKNWAVCANLRNMHIRRKRDLKRALEEQEKAAAQSALLLDQEQLNGLLEYLEERLSEDECDASLRFTREWAAANAIDADALAASVEYFTAICDCEVLANVEPETIF